MIRAEPVTQERVYRALRADLFSGIYHLRERMDLSALALRYGASKTPLREAIFRLVAERLLAQHPLGGYQIGVPDVDRLADLYLWNAQHLLAALHVAPGERVRDTLRPFLSCEIGSEVGDQIMLVGAFFRAIATATGNAEFVDQVDAANARLHYPRLAETNIFRDSRRELSSLLGQTGSNVPKSARRRILAYHRRRIEHADRIAAMWTPRGRAAK